MRILFLVRSLDVGGAEQQLVALAKGLAEAGHEPAVAVFYAGGQLETLLRSAGVPLFSVKKRSRWDLTFVHRLRAVHTAFRPDVFHTYMPSANKTGALLKPLLPRCPLVWGVRAGNMDLSRYGAFVRWSHRLDPLLARIPDAIVVNSDSGRTHARSVGFPDSKMAVVPNGFDCVRFSANCEARSRFRARWGIRDSDFLIGMVARLDPVKGHPTFLRAAALLAAERRDAQFVCVGGGDARYASEMARLGHQLGLTGRLRWEPSTLEAGAVYSAFDSLALPSESESFPNVVAEAMSCGVPCVATDVGDAAQIVGDAGIVVPPGRPDAFAAGMKHMLDLAAPERQRLSALGAARIRNEYSIDSMVQRTVAILERVVA